MRPGEAESTDAPPPEDVAMSLPCGTRLATRVWRPAGPGPWPVLLMRQPYGRAIASTVTLAHPSWYAAQGYVVAVQDVRGTGGSEGVFDPFAAEAADGAVALDWARELRGGNGRLGLYGFSYQGMTQMLALAGGGSADAIAPVMAAWDLWADFASEGGAFRLDWGVGWAMQMAAATARRAGDATAFAAFAGAAVAPPLDGPEPAMPGLARDHDRHCHLADWVAAIGAPEYWAARSPARMSAAPGRATPALHVGGWFDGFLTGTVAAHDAARRAGAEARLVIGPWAHIPWAGGALSVDRLLLSWFDYRLKDAPAPDGPPIRLYDLTRREWRGFDAWPEERTRFWLAGDGLAAAGSTGRLTEQAPRAGSAETFVHDPWRPVPARGHHLTPPTGMAERDDLDARADVAVFTSAPLARPLRLVGAPDLRAEVVSDADGFDLHAVLSRVDRSGTARTLTLGHGRFAGRGGARAVRLRPVAATLEPEERLRLSLSGAAWPAFAVNPGTGALPERTARRDCAPITLTIRTPATLDIGVAA